VGRALSTKLAARGNDLLLVASDIRDLKANADHLRLTYGVRVEVVAADGANPEECVAKIDAAAGRLGAIEGLFFPIGASLDGDSGMLPADQIRQLLNANLLVVMEVVGHFLPGLLAGNRGCIVGFGSIAAIRGRRNNVTYAAAKRGLASYFESIRHATAGTGIRVQFYQLGYVDTQQTHGRRLLFRPAQPADVAATVVNNLQQDFGTRYLPRYWALIAVLLGVLPWTLFRRLSF
jgi:short-subunit dehydrogenase